MTYNKLVEIFINDRKSYCSPKTVSTYIMHLERFRLYLCQVNVNDMDNVDTEILKGYLIYLRESGIKATSIKSYFRHLYALLSFAIENEYIAIFKYKIKLPRPDPDPILPLSDSELEHIIDYLSQTIESNRNILIIRLMIDMGLRSSEVRHLRKSDISGSFLTVYNSKCNKSRMLPIPSTVQTAINEFDISRYKPEEYILPLTESAMKSFFARLKRSTGISRLHAHLLRHTFATSYIINRNNLEYLRCYLGHESYAVTQGYIRLATQCNMIHYEIYEIDSIFQ